MATTTKKENKPRKIIKKYLKAPIKFLNKARDFYIRAMIECSDRVGYGMGLGCSMGQVMNEFPRSYSVSLTKSRNLSDDYKELLRAASTRSSSNNSTNNHIIYHVNTNKVARSYSVGVGRIDEEKPCDFFDDGNAYCKKNMFARSRSHLIGGRVNSYVKLT